MELSDGTRLRHYTVLGRVGVGGMGEVYRARDTRLERDVALKLLPAELSRNPEAKQRFLVEARAASGLLHPNVCTVHAVEEAEDGRLFIAMALYEGETLRGRLDRGRMGVDEALDVALQVADGLAAAHERGILHRDIKPANVALTGDGRAVILDFGLAKVADLDLTRPGTTLGTLAYMSPEQARGQETDARADVWALGVVLYEMLAGARPFQGEDVAVLRSILDDEPPPLAGRAEDVQPQLEALVRRCLVKDRERRMASASELARELRALRAPAGERGSRRALLAIGAAAALAVLGTVAWFASTRAAERRVRTEVLPELERQAELVRYDMSAVPGWTAWHLLLEAERVLGADPALEASWPRIACELNLRSEPAGALVRARAYGDEQGAWVELGRTPLEPTRVPWGLSQVEVSLAGHRTVEDILWGMTYFGADRRFVLDPLGSIPDGMVRVAYEPYPVQLPGLDHLETEPMVDFLIDRCEVTNAEYKRFVDAGGYRRAELWQVPFVRDGQPLAFEAAVARFTDLTGRPGPATWEAGDFPEGRGDHPVGGLSWYEAEAYARFAGKELPSIFQWNLAAFTFGSSAIIPLSNFGEEPAPVGSQRGVNRFGARDMAGNVREWCLNEVAGSGSRFILGGGWNDQRYAFNDAYAADAFDRSPTNGLRCVLVQGEEPNRERLARAIETPFRDFSAETPVDDETFAVFLRQFDYDRTPLNAAVESEERGEDGTRQVVSFDAAYGGERVRALVFLPSGGRPPYQAVVYFPGSNAIHARSSERVTARAFKGILASGRAVVHPIYKGTYERGTELDSDYPDETTFYKDHVIMWAKDLRRTVDYLEEREDVDAAKLAYYGVSWGGALGGILPAIETRLRCNVLYVAGMLFQRSLPEVDQLNYVPRVRQPTLMVNGEFDFFFPVETAQKPMFELLGAAPEHKRYEVYTGAHSVPRAVLTTQLLGWLDTYLGPVE